MCKCAKNKGVTSLQKDGASELNAPSKVPAADSADTADVTNSTKQNNKPGNKLDTALVEIVEVWPDLPEHIKAAIKALIEAHKSEKRCD